MNDKIWLQQPQESNLQYERFEDFLNYNGGKLNKYIEAQGISKTGLTDKALKKIATKFNWIKRKNVFLNHNQEIISNATDDALYASNFSQKVKNIETTLDKMYDLVLRPINDKIEKGESVFPRGKELDGLNKYLSVVKKFLELKRDISNKGICDNFPVPKKLEIERIIVLMASLTNKDGFLDIEAFLSSIVQNNNSNRINFNDNKNLMGGID